MHSIKEVGSLVDLITRQLIADCWAIMRWRLPLLVILTFASAFFEGATVASLLPLLSSLSGSTSGPTDRISGIVVDIFNLVDISVTPQAIAVLIVILIICSAVFFLVQSYLATR